MFESLDLVRDFKSSAYPNDLENLIHFLRINAKAHGGSSNT